MHLDPVDEGVLESKPGDRYHAVLSVRPRNLRLVGPDEVEAALQQFVGFLNGLSFAVQFVARAVPASLDDALGELETRRDRPDSRHGSRYSSSGARVQYMQPASHTARGMTMLVFHRYAAMVLSLTLVLVVALAASPGALAASGCSSTNASGTWDTIQGDGSYRPSFTLEQQSDSSISGTASLSAAEQANADYSGNTGSVTGSMRGSSLDVIVTWPARNRDGVVLKGEYRGEVKDASLSGQAGPPGGPYTVTWSGTCTGSSEIIYAIIPDAVDIALVQQVKADKFAVGSASLEDALGSLKAATEDGTKIKKLYFFGHGGTAEGNPGGLFGEIELGGKGYNEQDFIALKAAMPEIADRFAPGAAVYMLSCYVGADSPFVWRVADLFLGKNGGVIWAKDGKVVAYDGAFFNYLRSWTTSLTPDIAETPENPSMFNGAGNTWIKREMVAGAPPPDISAPSDPAAPDSGE